MRRPVLPRSGRPLGLLLAGTGMFLVSTDSLLIRIADIEGWTIAFMVGVWSIPVMGTIAVRTLGSDLWGELVRYRTPLLATGCVSSISTTAFTVAVTKTSVANVVAIIAAAPIVAALIARVAIGERASARTWRAIVATMAGIIVIVGGSVSGGSITGELLALTAIVGFGINLTIWRRLPDLPRSLVVLCAATVTAVVTSVPAEPLAMDADAFWATLTMGLFFGPVARFCMATATRYAKSAEVSLFTPVETVCASLWVWLWFGEVPTTTTLAGAAVVVTAVLYGITGPAADVTPAPTTHTGPSD